MEGERLKTMLCYAIKTGVGIETLANSAFRNVGMFPSDLPRNRQVIHSAMCVSALSGGIQVLRL